MARAALDREPVAAGEPEHEQLVEIDHLLEACEVVELVTDESARVRIPKTAHALFHRVAHLLAEGNAVVLMAADRLLTTQQAADILNMSRPSLVQVLERGELAFTKVGTHRRIRFEDLMAYKRQRDAKRHAALRDLTRMSQELGLYNTRSGAAR